MRREIVSKLSASQIINFAFSHPLFLISLILSCIFFVFTVALAFGGLSERWEKRFGKMLIVSIIPVFIWIVFFFRPFFNPVYLTVIVWLVFLGILGYRRANDKINELKYLDKSNSWRCPKCKAINELVYIFCKECNDPQPEKKH
ncbi:MAG: hypothetical protein L6416_05070 [Candidatus Omnitrophica bacterium]|nr:hypothetical protein [Candidatus Omnitrophota bacterium]